MKRLLLISDLHCGHQFGMTPPQWQYNARDGYQAKVGLFQREFWNWFSAEIEEVKKENPIDILILNGDAIDGKGERSGGTELVTTDRNEQVKIAKYCIDFCEAKQIKIISGTPYHTGKEEDFEATLAALLGGKYHNHLHINIAGVKFDIRHKVASSIIPHGRYTAPRREALWGALWAERGLMDKADFYIRSHVHYYTASMDASNCVLTTPCLQGWTKYGSRECSGVVDLGFIVFDCENGRAAMSNHFFDMRKFKVEFENVT
jgi:hypothetical protein